MVQTCIYPGMIALLLSTGQPRKPEHRALSRQLFCRWWQIQKKSFWMGYPWRQNCAQGILFPDPWVAHIVLYKGACWHFDIKWSCEKQSNRTCEVVITCACDAMWRVQCDLSMTMWFDSRTHTQISKCLAVASQVLSRDWCSTWKDRCNSARQGWSSRYQKFALTITLIWILCSQKITLLLCRMILSACS